MHHSGFHKALRALVLGLLVAGLVAPTLLCPPRERPSGLLAARHAVNHGLHHPMCDHGGACTCVVPVFSALPASGPALSLPTPTVDTGAPEAPLSDRALLRSHGARAPPHGSLRG